jgi:hypothetical protein
MRAGQTNRVPAAQLSHSISLRPWCPPGVTPQAGSIYGTFEGCHSIPAYDQLMYDKVNNQILCKFLDCRRVA